MRIIALSLVVTLAHPILACDICTSAFEIVPNERKSSIGFYYSTVYRNGYPAVQTKHSGHLNYIGSEVKEIYNIYDFRYRRAFAERFFGEIIVPLRNTYLGINHAQRFDRYGLGDIQMQITYRAIKPESERRFNHRLDLNLGADLPTGSWTDSVNQIILSPVYQLGSGSFDFWSSLSYVARIGMWGYSFQGMYRRNTSNPLHFKFGDALTADLSLFFIFDFGKLKVMPRTGAFYEHGQKSTYRGLYDLHSGEQMLSVQHGFSVYYKKFQFNGILRNVIVHQTQGVEIRQKYFGQFAVIYNF